METHPVPQNISSYEFRLVGDMTLKQFLQLAAGAVVAVILFRLPLIGIIKFPLSFLSALTGILMAFVPVNGRPFSTWLGAFVRAIYSPTEFIWMPTPPPQALAKGDPALTVTATPAAPSTFVPSFSSLITSKLSKVTPASDTSTPTATVILDASPTPPITPTPPQKEEARPAPTLKPQKAPAFHSIPVPEATPPATVPAPESVPAVPSPQSATVSTAPSAAATSLISAPTSPNILAGIVTDATDQPLGGTTVEIVDTATGIPARALRTNRLGQFQIAIPLTPGTYNVIAEKDDTTFNPVSIQVKGSIIPPIVISAHH